jgi:hypothetical protein
MIRGVRKGEKQHSIAKYERCRRIHCICLLACAGAIKVVHSYSGLQTESPMSGEVDYKIPSRLD